MRSVKLNKAELLSIVNKNAITHAEEYEEAFNDYKVAVLKIAKDNLKIANSGDLAKLATLKSFPNKPVSYSDSYKRAIRMLELSVDDVIELEEDIFNQLVLDEWSWKHQFTVASAMYKSLV